jgi:protein-tyrosine-phosphatase
MRVLVVCHGNKWRSPLAAELLRRRHPEWDVRSAGVGATARHGWRAAKPVREYAGGLLEHRSRQVDEEDLRWAEMVVFMDGGNLKRLRALGANPAKLRCLATETERIRDPAFHRVGSPEHKEIFDQIAREVDRL